MDQPMIREQQEWRDIVIGKNNEILSLRSQLEDRDGVIQRAASMNTTTKEQEAEIIRLKADCISHEAAIKRITDDRHFIARSNSALERQVNAADQGDVDAFLERADRMFSGTGMDVDRDNVGYYVHCLVMDHENSKKANGELTDEIQKIRKERDELSAFDEGSANKIEELKEQVSGLESEIKDADERLAQVVKQAAEDRDTMGEEVERLTRIIDSDKAKRSALVNKVTDRDMKIQAKDEYIASLQADNKAANTEIERQSGLHFATKAKLKSCEGETDEQRKKIERLEALVTEYQNMIDELRAKLTDSDKTIAHAKEWAEGCQKRADELEGMYHEKVKYIDQLEEKILSMARAVNGMTFDKIAMQDRYEAILRNPLKAIWFWLVVPRGSIPVD